jgi:hypothetical protein
MDDDGQVSSTQDAVRCLFLAREAERRGQFEVARRWREKADTWLDRIEKAWRPATLQDEPKGLQS